MINIEDIELKLKSPDIEERRRAALALKGHPAEADSKTVIRLLLIAMQDGSWRVRKTAEDILFDDFPEDVYMRSLIELLYIEDNAGARNAAIETLTKLNRRATPYLIKAFATENSDVRKFIIDVLGQFEDKRTLSLMLGALKDDDENVRASAVEHLGSIGGPSVVEALIDILESGDLWTAYPAADALGRIGDKRAIPALVDALSRKSLREPALKALGRLGDDETLKHILPFLDDKSKSVQEETIRVIEKLYKKGVSESSIVNALRAAFGEKALHLIIDRAWSSKAEVRAMAILLLGLLKDERSLEPLLEISSEEDFAEDAKRALIYIGKDKPETLLPLFDKNNPYLRRFICDVASDVAAPIYYDKLLEMLTDSDGHVRAVAARGLASIGDMSAVFHINRLLEDEYSDVQEAAIDALSRMKDGVDKGAIIENLRSPKQSLRKNSALLLGKMGMEGAVDALGFALKDESVVVRRAVVSALALINAGESMRHLTRALTDEDPGIRSQAALSLGAMAGKDALQPLSLLLSDPEDMVRVATARSLGSLNDINAVPSLIAALNDGNGFVVTTAVDALGRLGGEQAKEALLGMLLCEDKEILRTVIKALSGFDGIETKVIPFIKDGDWATRMVAVQTLSMHMNEEVRTQLEALYEDEEDPGVRKTLENLINV